MEYILSEQVGRKDDRLLVQFKLMFREGDKETTADFCLPVNFELKRSSRDVTHKEFLYEKGIIINTFDIIAHTFEIKHKPFNTVLESTFQSFDLNFEIDGVIYNESKFPIPEET